MAPWESALISVYSVIVLIVLLRLVFYSVHLRRWPVLTEQSPKHVDEDAPMVTIMVPVKDEAAVIENCLRSLLMQDYPHFEILVVDDRSVDGTAEIVERIADECEDGRLRLIRIQQLPDGWTGKTHALHVCRQHARGEWFLFVDADTWQHASCLSITMREALDNDVDMLSLLPAIRSQSLWEGAVQPIAGVFLLLLYPLTKVNDHQRKDKGFGNGQFILIHRKAYETIGGHAAVRDKFVEDIHMARRVRQGGLRLRVLLAPQLSSVRMYSSLREIVQGWSRILYSAVDCRPGRLYTLVATLLAFSVAAYAVFFVSAIALLAGSTSLFAKAGLVLAVIHELGQLALYAHIYAESRCSRRYLVFRFLGVMAMLYILARAIRLCSTHEVTWRGTSYNKSFSSSDAGELAAATPALSTIEDPILVGEGYESSLAAGSDASN